MNEAMDSQNGPKAKKNVTAKVSYLYLNLTLINRTTIICL